MRIGIPKEIKPREGRVGLIPAACSELVQRGHEVWVETTAGDMSGYSDEAFVEVGAKIAVDAAEVFDKGQMIVKVKEPIAGDLKLLKERHLLFCYLHLAALPELTTELQNIGLTAVAFETVEDAHGRLPLLAPMSDIAGRISVQVGTHLLHQTEGGRGILLGGVPCAPRGRVVVLGGGVAGGNAAVVAAGLGANVTVFDTNRDKLVWARSLGANVTGLHPHPADMQAAIAEADLVIGAVLVTGARAPRMVTEDMIKTMQPGAVVVDISVDQGGCMETTRPTTYDEPTFKLHDVIHFCVTNMPGAVPRTSSQALSAAVVPYVVELTSEHWRNMPELMKGINVEAGAVTHPALKA